MGKKFLYIALVFNSLLLTAGVVNAQEKDQAPPSADIFQNYLEAYYSQVFGIDVTGMLNADLYSSIEEWLGTPYRYAGKTLSGIDCSAFVNKLYEKAYCYLLSGTSADLFKKVTPLPLEKLREGDLVFFKINRKTISHVGVYLGNNKFVHASRTNGVVISDLTQPYYKKYFVKGGRVNFESN